jgi:hypothetical protein
MKTVFSSHSEVCHVFASRSQSEGRAGNISFNGDTINSYHWWPMARFIDDNTVLFVDHSYSNSTSKHLSHLRRALNHLTVIRVPDVSNLSLSILTIADRLKRSYNDFETARNKEAVYYDNCSQQQTLAEIETYTGFETPYLNHYMISEEPAMMAQVEQYRERKEAQRLERERKEDERRAMIRELIESSDFDDLREMWRSGQSNETFHYHKEHGHIDLFNSPALRIKGDNVQTSMGANVSIREAKILLERIRVGKDIKGFQIGYYTVISMNGTLKIGCHEITRQEIEDFTKRYNW